ncbi:hypothetical protein PTTG_08008 [Puccinia triticina 1-1 BBBD Race 1]|uniref:Uncharacterized protein n=1 Tax=Puccinia triticina (isolate 1-1 / race 1 (BBBD)) TaxID=630390 RepID=A0A180G3U8_PUCT1|nr:hypothetical protein PTTG_08008 [Puccinia triticina 1-1 BBBD Race 1]
MADPVTVEPVKIKPPHGKTLRFDGTNVERFLQQYHIAARLDKATGQDMAEQLFFFVDDGLLDVLETLEGYEPPNWPKLKASMLSYWGEINLARFTARDIQDLKEGWIARGGVSLVAEYQELRKEWEPIQAYLIAKGHVESVEEIRNDYYQSFSSAVQERIRDQLFKDNTMITTVDRRFKLPKFEVLKTAINEVMRRQTALIFEDTKSVKPVASSTLKEANEVMKKMGADKRLKDVPQTARPVPNMDDVVKMFESFEQKLEQKWAAGRPLQASGPRGPMVCFYCHREGHGTARCFELQKDKDDKLVEQKGTNFFLPNGALIPWDSSRPIRHVVASFQPSRPTTNQAAVDSPPGFKVGCGSLQPWYPPAVSSQSFLGVYEADPAGRKRHEEPKPFKAPSVPSSAAKRPLRRAPTPPVPEERSAMDEEPILFERGTGREDPSELVADTPLVSAPPTKPASPKVRFEREVSREHPNAVDGVLKKISILKVPDITVSELMAISPSIAEGMKKWVSRRRVEVGR